MHSACPTLTEVAELLRAPLVDAKNRITRLRLAVPGLAPSVTVDEAAWLLLIRRRGVLFAVERGELAFTEDGRIALVEVRRYALKRERFVGPRKYTSSGRLDAKGLPPTARKASP